ncbi:MULTISPECIES: response regulator transcription factor [Methylomonas]|uniref:LuxR family transcriptional regulator n=2 Tax=Methylomonas TaxID=416 RepID=A0A126T0Z5_9GAMM|nr:MULTISPECIES: response regulator [Methylomonas]AMK75755.1 LuxR family transcriptional regulator [Methylomonas denitrificans]OAH98251.1 DNA-binding response regulator [Methylomonas methanica]TCV82418.1 LuxR family two component transcriptional regulator [Methylomonas methanica]
MNTQPCVFIVDDDDAVRDSLGLVFETADLAYQTFASAEHFLESYCPGQPGCLVLDVNMPGLDGHELQAELNRRHIHLPIIFLTAYGDIPMTVRAIKAGAVDFLTKPVSTELLIDRVQAALRLEANTYAKGQAVSNRLAGLTARELEIMGMVVAGLANKEIARRLGISHRTVEIHRAKVMEKTGATNLLELVRVHEASRL